MAERVGQTFSVNRLADGPCRQSSFLNSMVMICQKIMVHSISCGLSSGYRRKRTLALRGRNQRRDTSEQAGERPLHSVAGKPSTLFAFESSLFEIFHLPAHALKNPGRRPPAISHLRFQASSRGTCPTLQMKPASSRASATIALLRALPLFVKCIRRLHSRC
jgi:hypothetical protein